jgi:hypothetical protein
MSSANTSLRSVPVYGERGSMVENGGNKPVAMISLRREFRVRMSELLDLTLALRTNLPSNLAQLLNIGFFLVIN